LGRLSSIYCSVYFIYCVCICYNLFLGRPDKAGTEVDNNCCMASLDKEHIGSLSLDQWVKDKQVKSCLRLEICKLTKRAYRIPCKVASREAS
jgi:hypothetical protein